MFVTLYGMMKNKRSIMIFFLLTAVFFPSATFATTIENDISSSSSSGGNNAENGNIVEGKSKSEVFIETMVDGEVVEKVHEVAEGENSSIEKEVIYENEEVEVKTSVLVTANASSTNTNQKIFKIEKEVISLNSSSTEATSSELTAEETGEKSFGAIISGFIKKMLSYVFNLF